MWRVMITGRNRKSPPSQKNHWVRINQGLGGGKYSVDPIFCDGGPLRLRTDTQVVYYVVFLKILLQNP